MNKKRIRQLLWHSKWQEVVVVTMGASANFWPNQTQQRSLITFSNNQLCHFIQSFHLFKTNRSTPLRVWCDQIFRQTKSNQPSKNHQQLKPGVWIGEWLELVQGRKASVKCEDQVQEDVFRTLILELIVQFINAEISHIQRSLEAKKILAVFREINQTFFQWI